MYSLSYHAASNQASSIPDEFIKQHLYVKKLCVALLNTGYIYLAYLFLSEREDSIFHRNLDLEK